MNRSPIFVFADEGGCMTFRRGGGASKYFILTTITITDCRLGDELLELRRQLIWESVPDPGFFFFHATEEKQVIRDRVFEVLARHEVRIDATIFEKSKAQPHLAADQDRFYKTAWHQHMKFVAPKVCGPNCRLMVTGASIGTNKKRQSLADAVKDVVDQVAPTTIYVTAYWPAYTDPCLQAADYCCWAIQRRWERGDDRSYNLIKDKIASEFDIFQRSSVHYY
jgi:hypothetical protein